MYILRCVIVLREFILHVMGARHNEIKFVMVLHFVSQFCVEN